MGSGGEQRRIVTSLFADVVGSVAVVERLDPEEARLLIGEAVGRSVQAVEAYGGTVVSRLGDGIFAVFGAPLAHEDDPERALRAALDIIAAARDYSDEIRRGWGIEHFAMRIGINTGEVVVETLVEASGSDPGLIADSINTASRLQTKAAPNEILVSEATRRHVADRFEWSEPRRFQLRGRSESITAFALTGRREKRAPEQGAAPMVGRADELDSALEVFGALDSGRGAALFIIGEPGIGKTRFGSELRDRALSKHKCIWMEGRCVSYGETLPYWPFRDLLRSWLEVSPSDPELPVRIKLRRRIEELFPGRGNDLYPYLATVLGLNVEPEAKNQLQSLSPESLQFRTFEVFIELIQRIAADTPVVVWLDDLHWADATSLALAERLVGAAESSSVVLALSQRPETEHPSWLLKEKAAREYRHLIRELTLQPLDSENEVQLLSSLARGRTLPSHIRDELLHYAEGNPFYLEQLVRSLIDSGSLIAQNSHWELQPGQSLTIPPTLEAVVMARIDRLQPQWRDILTSASVLGRTFGMELIESLTGMDSATLRPAIHHLLRLDLLREESGGAHAVYRFKHAVIQETANKTLVRSRRQALHRRAAEWYERYYDDRLDRVYGLIAHHWLQADDREKAAEYLKLAGDQALTEWALDEASADFGALVPLLESAGRQEEAAEALFQLAATLHLGMRYAEANETWQLAFERWKPTRRKASSEPRKAGLRVVAFDAPWEIDPAHAVASINGTLHRQLYDTLLNPRPGPSVVPNLAVRWNVADDGLQYRFELDSQARWNDGKPLQAADIVEGVRNVLEPATESTEASTFFPLENAEAFFTGQIDDFSRVGVSALDERTIEFRLHSPTPHWIFVLIQPAASGGRVGRTSGPYRARALSGSHALIERDPRYPDDKSGNVGIVEFVASNRDAAIEGLLRGDFDVGLVLGLDARVMEAIKNGDLVSPMGPPLWVGHFDLAGQGPNVLDIAARRALAYATDRRAWQPELYPNIMIATGGFVPPGLPGHTPNTALPYDPDRAREVLKGSTHSGPIRLAVSEADVPMPYWRPITAVWSEILGLEVKEVLLDVHQYQRWRELANVAVAGTLPSFPDPADFLQYTFHSRSSGNRGGWHSQTLDRLIDSAVSQKLGSRRLEFFHKADRFAVHDECMLIPLAYGRLNVLCRPWVHHWWVWTTGWQRFADLTIDERSPRANGLDHFDVKSFRRKLDPVQPQTT